MNPEIIKKIDEYLVNEEKCDPAKYVLTHNLHQTQLLALKQTISARSYIYHANIPELKTISEKLTDIVTAFSALDKNGMPTESLSTEIKNAIKKIKETNQNSNEDCSYINLIGERLFGNEGFIRNIYNNEKIQIGMLKREKEFSTLNDKERAELFIDLLRSHENSNSRMIILAFMGDIGSWLAENSAMTGVDANNTKKPIRLSILKEIFSVQGLKIPTAEHMETIKFAGTSNSVGPLKALQRQNHGDNVERTGIYDLGEDADNLLNIEIQKRIGKTTWKVARINKKRVQESTEPLVGHMSGSPTEILQVWDMLCGTQSELQYILMAKYPYLAESAALISNENAPTKRNDILSKIEELLEKQNNHQNTGINNESWRAEWKKEFDARKQRAAATAAFLIAAGYHSAVEVVESILTYLGQSPRLRKLATSKAFSLQLLINRNPSLENFLATIEGNTPEDAANDGKFEQGAATSIIMELLNSQHPDSWVKNESGIKSTLHCLMEIEDSKN